MMNSIKYFKEVVLITQKIDYGKLFGYIKEEIEKKEPSILNYIYSSYIFYFPEQNYAFVKSNFVKLRVNGAEKTYMDLSSADNILYKFMLFFLGDPEWKKQTDYRLTHVERAACFEKIDNKLSKSKFNISDFWPKDEKEKIIEEAKKEAEQIKSNAEVEAKNIIAAAKNKIREEASKEKENEIKRIIEEAEQRKEGILKEAGVEKERLIGEGNSQKRNIISEAQVKAGLIISDYQNLQRRVEWECDNKKQEADSYYNSKIREAQDKYDELIKKLNDKVVVREQKYHDLIRNHLTLVNRTCAEEQFAQHSSEIMDNFAESRAKIENVDAHISSLADPVKNLQNILLSETQKVFRSLSEIADNISRPFDDMKKQIMDLEKNFERTNTEKISRQYLELYNLIADVRDSLNIWIEQNSYDEDELLNSIGNYEAFMSMITEYLAEYGIQEIYTNAGDKFDGKYHEPCVKGPKGIKKLNDFSPRTSLIKSDLRSGFALNDVVLQKERVEVIEENIVKTPELNEPPVDIEPMLKKFSEASEQKCDNNSGEGNNKEFNDLNVSMQTSNLKDVKLDGALDAGEN